MEEEVEVEVPGSEPEEDALLLLVLVHGEELLLLRVEQPHHVPALGEGEGVRRLGEMMQCGGIG